MNDDGMFLFEWTITGKEKVADIDPTGHMEIVRPGKEVRDEGVCIARSATTLRHCLLRKYNLFKPWVTIIRRNRKIG